MRRRSPKQSLCLVFLLTLLCVTNHGFAQNNNSLNSQTGGNNKPESTPLAQDAAPVGLPPEERSNTYLSDQETRLTIGVLVIGLVALILESLLLRKIKNLQAEDMLRVFGVTLILIGTLFLITASFSAQQIAPALGLFGTVAGYLLAKADRKGDASNDETKGR